MTAQGYYHRQTKVPPAYGWRYFLTLCRNPRGPAYFSIPQGRASWAAA